MEDQILKSGVRLFRQARLCSELWYIQCMYLINLSLLAEYTYNKKKAVLSKLGILKVKLTWVHVILLSISWAVFKF